MTAVSASFTPASIASGLKLWLRADLGFSAGQWNDQSGNGYNFTQSTAGRQPALVTGGQNGLPRARFSGGQVLLNGSIAVTAPFTVWAVGNCNGPSGVTGNQCLVTLAGANLFAVANGSTWGCFENAWVNSSQLLGSTPRAMTAVASAYNSIGFRTDGYVDLPQTSGVSAYAPVALGCDNGTPSSGNPYNGDLYEVAVWNRALTTAEMSQLDAYGMARYGFALQPSLVVGEGNSFMAGNGASGPSKYLLAQTAALLGSTWFPVNNGIGGETTPNMDIYSSSHTDPLVVGQRGKCVTIGVEITNDLYFGATPAQAIANIITYCTNRRAAGQKVVISSVLSRSNVGTPVGFNANRHVVNAYLDANALSFADGYAPWHLDPTMGVDGAETNLNVFAADFVHPNDNGYALLAATLRNAVLYAAYGYTPPLPLSV